MYSRSRNSSFNDKRMKEIDNRKALSAVKKAIEFKEMKEFKKAVKFFEHAMDLSPYHPEVLLNYGEFLESNKDFINADHLYLKALIVDPKNTRALDNRKRTLPIVNQIDLDELMRIEKKKEFYNSLDKIDPTLYWLKRELYFQHIHHTVAIEGNTMSLAQTQSVLETGLAVQGKSVLEHNEILGLKAAYQYVEQTLAPKNSSITISDILEIHRRVFGYTDPISAGSYRKCQVYVGEHIPPPASDVELLMEEFIQQLQSCYTTNMHPIHIAAFAHQRHVCIHPFIDGNGRTTRLLMNLILMRFGYPPIIIRNEDSSEYFDYLQLSVDCDTRPFYRFVARVTECMIDTFLNSKI